MVVLELLACVGSGDRWLGLALGGLVWCRCKERYDCLAVRRCRCLCDSCLVLRCWAWLCRMSLGSNRSKVWASGSVKKVVLSWCVSKV